MVAFNLEFLSFPHFLDFVAINPEVLDITLFNLPFSAFSYDVLNNYFYSFASFNAG